MIDLRSGRAWTGAEKADWGAGHERASVDRYRDSEVVGLHPAIDRVVEVPLPRELRGLGSAGPAASRPVELVDATQRTGGTGHDRVAGDGHRSAQEVAGGSVERVPVR